MKLFIKILLVVFVALLTNVEVVRASITFSNIHETTTSFSFQNKTPKISFKITENDLANSCKNEWDLVDYRNWVRSSEAVAAKGGTSVLGKYPDYINLSEQLGAKRFNVPTNIWNKMSVSEQWTANQKFLDRMIMRGDKIILSNPVLDINKVSGAFRQELDYLIGKGYRLNSTGTQLIK